MNRQQGGAHNAQRQIWATDARGNYLAVGAQLRQDVLHHELVHDAAVVAKGLWPAFLRNALVHVHHDIGGRNVRRDAEFFAAVRHVHVQGGGLLGVHGRTPQAGTRCKHNRACSDA